MKKGGILEALFKNASYIVIVLISLIYIASSLIMISKTGKSVLEILGTGALSLIVGMLINSAFRGIGLRRGEADERTLSTSELHASVVEEISPYIDKLDEFCELENARALKIIRSRILMRAGLKYENCFDESAMARELDLSCADKTKTKQMIKAYKKAQSIKIKPLTPFALTCDSVDSSNPYDLGKSKREFERQKGMGDIATRIIMALIFGYFGVTLVSEVNVSTIIWNSLQIIMYLTSGVIGMYSSYMWLVDEHRASVIKKIDILQKFKLYVDKTQKQD